MKKILTCAVSALALASCSSDSLVSDSPANTQAPIAFNVGQKNITRSTNLEDAKHYNFGVWAYKTRTSGDPTSQLVMENYLVGYSDGAGKGYDNSKVKESTWESSAGSETDHKSSWFYEGLGSSEYSYKGDASFYKTSESARANQYLRYWDLAYTNTNFYAYAPYKSSGVSFKNGIITVEKEANVAGYDDPAKYDFIYAGTQATNAEKKDVKLTFKHLGALVKVAFRENVNGYKVQLINVKKSSSDPNEKLGVQATSAKVSGNTYIHTDATTQKDVTYLTSCGATINFADNINTPEVKVVTTDVTPSSDNLMFDIPTEKKHGLVGYKKDENSTEIIVLPDMLDKNYDGKYSVSPTTYYAVVQPTDSETGFTFHISYNLIAEDNGEVVTVRDARVHVPAEQVRWQSNTSYTYNFTISQVSSGTTDPTVTPNLADPTVPVGTVVPIVFDGATIENYENAVTY
ncbi:fimbrillin family protein [Xylanibacter ruminicola]|uniref:fimbrillin family protein n=1 Tax=Xylanibacter ruminicola TaxID=839 RepID=UPI00048DC051|nr:fimbrillin family protein [Xylanibacter ruminicola]